MTGGWKSPRITRSATGTPYAEVIAVEPRRMRTPPLSECALEGRDFRDLLVVGALQQ
jgi:hypothetical protein